MGSTLTINAVDRLELKNTAKIAKVSTSDKLVVVAEPSVRVGSTDSYVLVPKATSTSVDYNIPQSVVNGIADVAAIREDLLLKLAGLDIAVSEAKSAIDNVYESVRYQIYTEMETKYLSNTSSDAIRAIILDTDLSTMKIKTSPNGTTEATFQELADRYIEVGEAVGGFTEQLNVNTTAASSAVQATEVLTAKVGDIEATISSGEYVAVGGFTEYTTGIPVTGQWRGSPGSYEQYRADSWVPITDAQHARYLKQLAIAGAKSLSTVGDTVVGWEYANGGAGDNEFKIKADKFYLEAAGSSTKQSTYVPFSVDATSGEISFNGKVTFGNSVIDTVDPTNTVIDGGSITTGTIDANRINSAAILTKVITLDSSGPEAKVTNSSGTMIIDFKNGSIYIA